MLTGSRSGTGNIAWSWWSRYPAHTPAPLAAIWTIESTIIVIARRRAHSLPLAADRSAMMVLFRNVTVQLAAMDNNAAVR